MYTYTILWIPLAPKIIGMLKTSEHPIWPCAMPPGQARGGSHFPWWPQRQCPGVSGTGRWFVCLSGCCPQSSEGYARDVRKAMIFTTHSLMLIPRSYVKIRVVYYCFTNIDWITVGVKQGFDPRIRLNSRHLLEPTKVLANFLRYQAWQGTFDLAADQGWITLESNGIGFHYAEIREYPDLESESKCIIIWYVMRTFRMPGCLLVTQSSWCFRYGNWSKCQGVIWLACILCGAYPPPTIS